jgi:hypothetical protein
MGSPTSVRDIHGWGCDVSWCCLPAGQPGLNLKTGFDVYQSRKPRMIKVQMSLHSPYPASI